MTHNVADSVPPSIPDELDTKPKRTTRSLVGWMTPQEAIQHVLGRMPSSPVEEATAISIAEPRRAAAAARSAVSLENPIVTGTDRSVLVEVASRPEIHAAFAGQFVGVEWVDLTKLISIQKMIFTDGTARVEAAMRDGATGALVELCLPRNQQLSALGLATDVDGRGMTIVSDNPNLRLQGTFIGDVDVQQGVGDPKLMKAISFVFGMGSPYLSVTEYQGRYYLQNGYHRAAALLRMGTTVVPAVMTAVRSYDELVAPGSGLFGHGVASAAAPPMLPDFWDDAVSVEASQPFMRKVLRVRGDEFPVNV